MLLPGGREVQGTVRDDRLHDQANLDDGNMWATAFALEKLTKADEKRITELVERAVS